MVYNMAYIIFHAIISHTIPITYFFMICGTVSFLFSSRKIAPLIMTKQGTPNRVKLFRILPNTKLVPCVSRNIVELWSKTTASIAMTLAESKYTIRDEELTIPIVLSVTQDKSQ